MKMSGEQMRDKSSHCEKFLAWEFPPLRQIAREFPEVHKNEAICPGLQNL